MSDIQVVSQDTLNSVLVEKSTELAVKESKETEKQTATTDDKSEVENTKESETLEADESASADDSDEQESNEEDSQGNQDEKKKPKSNGFKKRIDKLNKQRTEEALQRRLAEQERDHWKAEALKAKPQSEIQGKNAANKTDLIDGKPKSENYDTHEEYVDAITDFKFEQKAKQAELKLRQDTLKSEQQAQAESFQEKLQLVKSKHDDFEDVIEAASDINYSYGIQDAIMSSDVAPHLMYELTKDRTLLERISKMSDTNAIKEIGKIEARLEKSLSEEPSKKETTQTKTTKAPPPLKPIGSSGSVSVKTLQTADYDEYKKIRQEQLRNG